jgi:beta-N-acetylhexosaminidase
VTGSAAVSPAAAAPLSPGTGRAAADWAQHVLQGMTLEQKAGQLFIADIWGKSADHADPGKRAKYGVDTPAEVIAR